ncbi:PIPNB protein, partial [Polypterus senegalus]
MNAKADVPLCDSCLWGMSALPTTVTDLVARLRVVLPCSVEENEYMKDDFFIKIETWHKPDMGTLENVHELDPVTWKSVEVVPIDIADRSQVDPGDYKEDEDPALFHSEKTGRGPLGPNWKQEKRIFTNFHRQLFCWVDRWVELTMEDIRRMEDETQRELEEVSMNVFKVCGEPLCFLCRIVKCASFYSQVCNLLVFD